MRAQRTWTSPGEASKTAAEIKTALETLSAGSRLDSDYLDEGSTNLLLTSAERSNISANTSKLSGIEDNATADQTPSEMVTALETLSAGSRLDSDYLDEGATNLLLTSAERSNISANTSKLSGIEDNATADQTASEIKDALEGLTSSDILDMVLREQLPTIENDTDGDHDITIGAFRLKLYNGSSYKYFTSDSEITKQIDAAWDAGNDAGGFPSGLSLAADTGYYIFVIGKADGTIDIGYDTSATAANLLADATGYTYYRAVWWVITDSSSNIVGFTQVNDDTCEYDEAILDVSDTTTVAGVEVTATISAPPSSEGLITLMHVCNSSTAATSAYINGKLMSLAEHQGACYTRNHIDGSREIIYSRGSTIAVGSSTIYINGWRKKF